MQGRSLDEIFELYSFAHPVLGGQNMQDSRFAFNFQIVPRIHVWYDMYIMNGYHRGPWLREITKPVYWRSNPIAHSRITRSGTERLKIEEKRENEKRILEKMILLYCKKQHGAKAGLCSECEELRDYAFSRSDNCPVMETKTFCSKCTVHCYSLPMRERIRAVMRFSAGRLLFRNPILIIRYLIVSIKEKKK